MIRSRINSQCQLLSQHVRKVLKMLRKVYLQFNDNLTLETEDSKVKNDLSISKNRVFFRRYSMSKVCS